MLHQGLIDRLYNQGERLVPFSSHNAAEMRRHFSSYLFFMDVLRHDAALLGRGDFHILEIGFGSGFGSYLLASLPEVARVTAVDVSPVCREYAETVYPSSKVEYRTADAVQLPAESVVYDYIVSRGVLERIPDGLILPFRCQARRRIMVNVPYLEQAGNHHHCILGIDENCFAQTPATEFLYEAMDGEIREDVEEDSRANVLFAMAAGEGLPAVRSCMSFPRPPASVAQVQEMLATAGPLRVLHEKPQSLLQTVEAEIEATDVVLDVGPGIMPMNYFRPKLHMLLEPCQSYARILSERHRDDKSVLVLQSTALNLLPSMTDKSVDSIFLLNVLEHMPKEEGREVLQHVERLARRQIVVFTPLGFLAQHVPEGDKDGFGLDGHDVQEHRSGWLPEDFGRLWKFHICPTFHRQDFEGKTLPEPRGAFFALRTFYDTPKAADAAQAANMPDMRPVLPSEKALNENRAELAQSRQLLGHMNEAFARTMHMWSGNGAPHVAAPQYLPQPLHVGFPHLGDRALFTQQMEQILDSRWFSNNGAFVREFERRLCERWGVDHAVAVANGTLALMLACRGLELKGEVIMPALTFPGTAHALHWQGLTPVFADVDMGTGLLSPSAVEAAITPRTAAILGVHLWGRPCAVEDLQNIARRHGLHLFFDASHAADCTVGGISVGNFGECECFSLHATNVLHSFEGGLITTNNAELAHKLRLLRNFGISGEDSYEGAGINAKMSEPCAAMGLCNLEHLDALTEENRKTHEAYAQGLHHVPGIEVLPYGAAEARTNYHSMMVRVLPEFGLSRDMLHVWLKGHNVWARRQYWPGCHRIAPYASQNADDLPYTDRLCSECLTLPAGPQLVEGYVENVCDLIRHVSFPALRHNGMV